MVSYWVQYLSNLNAHHGSLLCTLEGNRWDPCPSPGECHLRAWQELCLCFLQGSCLLRNGLKTSSSKSFAKIVTDSCPDSSLMTQECSSALLKKVRSNDSLCIQFAQITSQMVGQGDALAVRRQLSFFPRGGIRGRCGIESRVCRSS